MRWADSKIIIAIALMVAAIAKVDIPAAMSPLTRPLNMFMSRNRKDKMSLSFKESPLHL